MKNDARYDANEIINFGKDVLMKAGYSLRDALTAAKILVEADLRGVSSHGIAGGSSLDDILDKKKEGGVTLEKFEVLPQKYTTIFNIDAKGSLGHVAADAACDLVIEKAKETGYAKAYIFNSSHFGIAGYYSEKIANHNLAGRVTCTSPVWTKPFIESGIYDGVQKRFGTNPIAWSIPCEGEILTLDMASTQRAVSPAIKVAKDNFAKLMRLKHECGIDYVSDLEQIQGEAALGKGKYSQINKQLKENLGIELAALPEQYVLDKEGREVRYPLSFNGYFKSNYWIAPLGGTTFGYKGFILNMMIEMDNITGGGNPNPIPSGNQSAEGRVSQTVEAYCIDHYEPIDVIKRNLRIAVERTITSGGDGVKLPGQKEHEFMADRLSNGIPYNSEQIGRLVKAGEDAGVEFNVNPK
ncbi:Ldh family oxidoreductase [Candidatus Woesearchaeota archaeon]|nr:Ldh family oxidoreductase [Candidatus Woesearchaeota archaeon]